MPGPDIWGPPLWKSIHYIALAYPNYPSKNDKNRYEAFFTNLVNVIPCGICADHYQQNLLKHPLKEGLENKMSLINWTIDMHNEVNKSNKSKIYSYEEGLNEILRNNVRDCGNTNVVEKFTTTNTPIYDNPYIYVILLLLIVIIYLYNCVKSSKK
jgi:hypothetical protein